VLMCWYVDVFMCWCIDVLMCWCADVLMCWCVDVWMSWCVDMMMWTAFFQDSQVSLQFSVNGVKNSNTTRDVQMFFKKSHWHFHRQSNISFAFLIRNISSWNPSVNHVRKFTNDQFFPKFWRFEYFNDFTIYRSTNGEWVRSLHRIHTLTLHSHSHPNSYSHSHSHSHSHWHSHSHSHSYDILSYNIISYHVISY